MSAPLDETNTPSEPVQLLSAPDEYIAGRDPGTEPAPEPAEAAVAMSFDVPEDRPVESTTSGGNVLSHISAWWCAGPLLALIAVVGVRLFGSVQGS